jgi:CubicO group peptidase (beta-lactamase class C family)
VDKRAEESLNGSTQSIDPISTDAAQIGWMQGFPPEPDRMIRFADGSLFRFPRTRWAFSHMRELVPTANVRRGSKAASSLPESLQDLDALTFQYDGSADMTWAEMLLQTYTDSIVVLHRGRIVYEKYFGAAKDYLPHSCYSITKSFVGTLAAMLSHDGVLDTTRRVTDYIPELADGAYQDATVQQVMDMQVGVRYSEDYADKTAEIWEYSRAGGMSPRKHGTTGPGTFYEFLVTLQKEGEHGEAFAYKTVNTEVLAWILRRVTGMPLATLLSEGIWQKIGAENDAYFQVDAIGTEAGGGGLHVALRDLARFGEVMRLEGSYLGEQIIPSSVVRDIFKGEDPAKFAKAGFPAVPGFEGYSYHNMWWVSHNSHQVIDGRGIYGQRLYIDPAAEMVIAKFSSHPVASSLDTLPLTDRAFQMLAEFLMQSPVAE